MSTLSQRLALPEEAGVFELPVAKADTLQVAAVANGFPCVHISLEGAEDRESVLERFATALQFPNWFDPNWDSLKECLTDLSWIEAPGYVLVIEDASGYEIAAGEEFDTLVGLLSEASASWSGLAVPFWAFILR